MEGDPLLVLFFPGSEISIHSLRMEGDRSFLSAHQFAQKFQSTPSAWRETNLSSVPLYGQGFQSTPSAWRETDRPTVAFSLIRYFNPLPPHGGRQAQIVSFPRCHNISIHSLRMEGDPGSELLPGSEEISIHSLRMEGDQEEALARTADCNISIHSLRMEGDICAFTFNFSIFISIHSLRMEGDFRCFQNILLMFTFQSTPSAWRETQDSNRNARDELYFNPLPPHGGRHVICLFWIIRRHFNPLPPHGGRLSGTFTPRTDSLFQSTPSAWRETDVSAHHQVMRRHFNPLPPHGGRRCTDRSLDRLSYFNPLPPHGGRQISDCSKSSTSIISIHSLRMEGD